MKQHSNTRADGLKPEYNEVIIQVIECQGLRAADRKLIGKSTSDPYVTVKDVKGLIGSDKRTPVVMKNLNPKWTRAVFPYHFNYKLTRFKFIVKDYDDFSDDDLLGKVNVPIHAFYNIPPDGSNFRTIDQWFNLIPGKDSKWYACRGVQLGRMHLRISVRLNIPMAIPNTLIPLNTPQFHVCLGWDFGKGNKAIDLDASIAGLDHANNMVDYCAFSRLHSFNGQMRHSGDDRTGEGGGDDETVTINAMAPEFSQVDRFLIFINCYSGQKLDKLRNAYVRIVSQGRTLTFYTFQSIPACTGLIFGQILRINGMWHFITACQPANGRTLMDSLPVATQICTQQQMHHLPQTMNHNMQLPPNLHIGDTYNCVVEGRPVPVTVPETYNGQSMNVQVAIPVSMTASEAGGQLLRSAVSASARDTSPPSSRRHESPSGGERNVQEMSVGDLCAFLESMHLGHVAPKFRENGIDGQFFSTLSDQDLETQLGLKPLQIRNIRSKLR
eukprot:GEMP01018702.1.p1 GENE.GEMP01018702.1~~GEMP01018702.1.p1  ORF type:complete len:498 (+),score=80.62 GEMP01018702.1:44-1537(+)